MKCLYIRLGLCRYLHFGSGVVINAGSDQVTIEAKRKVEGS